MTVGARIRQVRQAEGLTMREFVARIGISAPSLSLIENGKSGASPQTIRSISREFGVSEDWLRDGVGEMRPPPDRDAELGRMVASLFRERPEGFRRRLLTLLLSWAPDGPEWALLERIVLDLQAEAASTQATQQDTPQNLGGSAPIK
ncbi:MAG: helix-turn-helix transcriptional regulator [Oscillospiraceae bacterium]|nr:helix-turn-helix transcriptional regulator [Oscillospiraceae bacterium]